MRVEHADPASVDETTMLIAGLERPLTLMQISDSHLTEVDARDPEVLERGLQLRATFLIKFLFRDTGHGAPCEQRRRRIVL